MHEDTTSNHSNFAWALYRVHVSLFELGLFRAVGVHPFLRQRRQLPQVRPHSPQHLLGLLFLGLGRLRT